MIEGKTYRICHERFGSAIVKAINVDDEWTLVLIISGELTGTMMAWGPGDFKTLLRSHIISFEEV